MKLNNIQAVNRKAGMTLLELTVVILVLLSLISILFIGARAWKKGSDRSACIINIRNVQQACRGLINMNPSRTTPVTEIEIYTPAGGGTDGFLKEPICPSDPTRTYASSYSALQDGGVANPDPGHVFLVCAVAETLGTHIPDGTDDW